MTLFRPFKPRPAEIRPFASSMNICRRSSAGLAFCYAQISIKWEQQKQGRQIQGPVTAEDGKLLLPPAVDLSEDVNPLDEHALPWLGGRFRYLEELGEGTFSQTIRAEDMYDPNRRHVAIKIINSMYTVIGEEEGKRIYELNSGDEHNVYHIIHIVTTFTYYGHFCLVFELLRRRKLAIMHLLQSSMSEYAWSVALSNRRTLEQRKLSMIRKIAYQLMLAMHFLHKRRLVHADLKPDNLLFRDETSCHVKIIDFGNAFHEKDASVYFDSFEVQTMAYRAPEVLVGVPFGAPIDMWSIGVILCETWLGRHMFMEETPALLVMQMMQVLGPLPKEPFSKGKFFYPHYAEATSIRPEHVGPFNLNDSLERQSFRTRRLSEVLDTRDVHFLQFLMDLLEYDPSKRLKPDEAVFHPFFASLLPVSALTESVRPPKPNGWHPLSSPIPSALRRSMAKVVVVDDEKENRRHMSSPLKRSRTLEDFQGTA